LPRGSSRRTAAASGWRARSDMAACSFSRCPSHVPSPAGVSAHAKACALLNP
jgi:hypothetical protein